MCSWQLATGAYLTVTASRETPGDYYYYYLAYVIISDLALFFFNSTYLIFRPNLILNSILKRYV